MMLARSSAFLFLLFWFHSLGGGELQLLFYPENPVEISCIITTEAVQEHGQKATYPTFHQQEFKVLVSVLSDQGDLPLSQLPIKIRLNFKTWKWNFKLNQESKSYDVANPGVHAFTAQMARLIDRPFEVYWGEDGIDLAKSPDLKWILGELSILREMDFKKTLESFLSPIFSLAGQDLRLGATYPVKTFDSLIPILSYQLVQADSNSYQAKWESVLPQHSISCKGHIIWKKQQALDMQYESLSTFEERTPSQDVFKGKIHTKIQSAF